MVLLNELPPELLDLIVYNTPEEEDTSNDQIKSFCRCSTISTAFTTISQALIYEYLDFSTEGEALAYLNSDATNRREFNCKGMTLVGEISEATLRRIFEVVGKVDTGLEGLALLMEGEFDMTILLAPKFSTLKTLNINMKVTFHGTEFFPFELKELGLECDFSCRQVQLLPYLARASLIEIFSRIENPFTAALVGASLQFLPLLERLVIEAMHLRPENFVNLNSLKSFETSSGIKKVNFKRLEKLISALPKSTLEHFEILFYGNLRKERMEKLGKLIKLPSLSNVKLLDIFHHGPLDEEMKVELLKQWENRGIKASFADIYLELSDDEEGEEGGVGFEEEESSADESGTDDDEADV